MQRDASKKAINNKGIKDNKGDKKLGQFYSPDWLAELCNIIIGNPDGATICEPTVGRGALLKHINKSNIIYGYDIDLTNVLYCKNNYSGVFLHDDVLKVKSNKKYDYVISNPPFGISSFDKKELYYLGGKVPNNSTSRFIQNNHHISNYKSVNIVNETVFKDEVFTNYMIKNNLIEAIYYLPLKTFMYASVSTVIIVTSKIKKDNNIKFYNLRDLEYDYTRIKTGYREYNNRWYYKKQLVLKDSDFKKINNNDEKITIIKNIKELNNIDIYFNSLFRNYENNIKNKYNEISEEYKKENNENIIWSDFVFSDVFNVSKGQRYKRSDHIEGDIPYVSSSKKDNGINCYIGAKEGINIYNNVITICRTGSVGFSFYHNYNCIISDNLNIITPKNKKLNKQLGEVLSYIFTLNFSHIDYSEGLNMYKLRDKIIKLPVKNGVVDFETLIKIHAIFKKKI